MPDYVLLTLASSLVYSTATALQKHGIATRLPEFALEDVFSRFSSIAGRRDILPVARHMDVRREHAAWCGGLRRAH